MRIQRTTCSLVSFGVVLLAATVLGSSRLPAQTSESGPSGARCEAIGSWSAETPLQLPDGLPVFVEPGSAEVHPLGTLALGTPSLVWLRQDRVVPSEPELARLDTAHARWSFTRAGFLVRPDGNVMPLEPPPRGAPMLDPSVRLAGSGAYHVVWGEDSRGRYEPERLWYARLDATADGGGAHTRWSEPVLVADGGTLTWGDQSTNQLAARADSLVFAATARDSAGRYMLVAFGSGGAWRTAAYRDNWMATYVAAGLSKHGMPLLVFAGHAGNRPGLWAVTLAAWDEAGDSWHAPVPLDTVDGLQAREIRLAHLGGDSLLVVWERRSADGGGIVGLAAVVSPDGGAGWHAAGDLPMTGGLRGLRLLVDAAGGVHALYVGSRGGNVLGVPGSVQHVRWRDGQWDAGATVSSRESFTQPLAAVTSDGIMAIWGEGRLEGENIVPRSYAAWWRSSCRSGP